MHFDTIISHTPDSLMKGIAARVKEKRLARNLTQKAFARRADVGYDAYRRFESTGEITLRNLILCGLALGEVEEFAELFSRPTYRNMNELLKSKETPKRRRGSINE